MAEYVVVDEAAISTFPWIDLYQLYFGAVSTTGYSLIRSLGAQNLQRLSPDANDSISILVTVCTRSDKYRTVP